VLRLLAAVGALALGSLLVWANWSHDRLGGAATVDLVVVRKADRRLDLLSSGSIIKTYQIALGGEPVGPKEQEGDEKTPEGVYTIDYRKEDSSFHRALHISYPSAAEQQQAEAYGVDPGGLIMIHGLPNGLGFVGRLHRMLDWTDGCIAVTNSEIEEIWQIVPDGTSIQIEP
jgi:murein L,D-transpeptidase YafK